MAEHIEVARAFVTIVPSMEGSQAEISKELTGSSKTTEFKVTVKGADGNYYDAGFEDKTNG